MQVSYNYSQLSHTTVHPCMGWHGGESTCLPPMSPMFDSQTWRHMWVKFVVGPRLCLERYFSRYSGFPSPPKPTFTNSNLIQNLRTTGLSVLTVCFLLSVTLLNEVDFIYLFIYLFIFIFFVMFLSILAYLYSITYVLCCTYF